MKVDVRRLTEREIRNQRLRDEACGVFINGQRLRTFLSCWELELKCSYDNINEHVHYIEVQPNSIPNVILIAKRLGAVIQIFSPQRSSPVLEVVLAEYKAIIQDIKNGLKALQ